MGTLVEVAGERPVAVTVPKGCKGPECPAFATCRGMCATRPTLRVVRDMDEGRRLGLER